MLITGITKSMKKYVLHAYKNYERRTQSVSVRVTNMKSDYY